MLTIHLDRAEKKRCRMDCVYGLRDPFPMVVDFRKESVLLAYVYENLGFKPKCLHLRVY